MTAPTCPRHQKPLDIVEEGVLNGVLVRYWAGCPGRICLRHADDPTAPRTGCICQPCRYETRTEDSDHVEPDLFGGVN